MQGSSCGLCVGPVWALCGPCVGPVWALYGCDIFPEKQTEAQRLLPVIDKIVKHMVTAEPTMPPPPATRRTTTVNTRTATPTPTPLNAITESNANIDPHANNTNAKANTINTMTTTMCARHMCRDMCNVLDTQATGKTGAQNKDASRGAGGSPIRIHG